jgi:hypothetical protein
LLSGRIASLYQRGPRIGRYGADYRSEFSVDAPRNPGDRFDRNLDLAKPRTHSCDDGLTVGSTIAISRDYSHTDVFQRFLNDLSFGYLQVSFKDGVKATHGPSVRREEEVVAPSFDGSQPRQIPAAGADVLG